MSEQSMIDDVRAAKAWLDQQSATFAELREHLRAIEATYQNRAGEYEGIPMQRPTFVEAVINAAVDEPGRELLGEARSPRRS